MGHLFLTIYRESVLPLAIWPQVVDATHVVVMLMCDKECIQIALTMKPQHLLAEIRPAVNQREFGIRDSLKKLGRFNNEVQKSSF